MARPLVSAIRYADMRPLMERRLYIGGSVQFAIALVLVLLSCLPVVAQELTVATVSIPSGNTPMFGSMFIGTGPAPRPTVVLLKGHPGSSVIGRFGRQENVLELAEPLQRAGFDVLAFNFRGSWGSGGTYSQTGRIDDVIAAVAFLRSAAATRFEVDQRRLTVVGHSMGGMNALIAGADQPDLMCTVGIAPANLGPMLARLRPSGALVDVPAPGLSVPVAGLGGYTNGDLVRDYRANQSLFDVGTRLTRLKGRPLLIVEAKRDETVAAAEIAAYVTAARAAGVTPFEHVVIDTDHNFMLDAEHVDPLARKELASVVVPWMTKHCK